LPRLAKFGMKLALPDCVKQLNKERRITMTLEKKTLTSKKTAPRNTGKKVDSRKVTTDKVVTAMRMITTKRTLS
jgi:hypothetical protein